MKRRLLRPLINMRNRIRFSSVAALLVSTWFAAVDWISVAIGIDQVSLSVYASSAVGGSLIILLLIIRRKIEIT